MKKNFSFNNYKIKEKKYALNFIDAFKPDKKNNNLIYFNSFLKNKDSKLPLLNISKNKTVPKKYLAKFDNKNIHQNITTINNNSLTDIKNLKNNKIVNSQKKKQKSNLINIPKGKNQNNQYHNINQNFVININNSISNSYQIKMKNNTEQVKKDYKQKKFNFSNIKIIKSEESNKNTNISKSNYSEISDMSCFNSNHKLMNINSINSFWNNDNDLFSISEDINMINKDENNINEKEDNDIDDNSVNEENKKVYIDPIEFEKFCKEVNDKFLC
jgi:hypothetical protein